MLKEIHHTISSWIMNMEKKFPLQCMSLGIYIFQPLFHHCDRLLIDSVEGRKGSS